MKASKSISKGSGCSCKSHLIIPGCRGIWGQGAARKLSLSTGQPPRFKREECPCSSMVGLETIALSDEEKTRHAAVFTRGI